MKSYFSRKCYVNSAHLIISFNNFFLLLVLKANMYMYEWSQKQSFIQTHQFGHDCTEPGLINHYHLSHVFHQIPCSTHHCCSKNLLLFSSVCSAVHLEAFYVQTQIEFDRLRILDQKSSDIVVICILND